MKNGYVNINGAEKKMKSGYINVGGVMKKIKNGWVNVGGVMKPMFSSYVKNFYFKQGTSNVYKYDESFSQMSTIASNNTLASAALLDRDYNFWVVPNVSTGGILNKNVYLYDKDLRLLGTKELSDSNISDQDASSIDSAGRIYFIPRNSSFIHRLDKNMNLVIIDNVSTGFEVETRMTHDKNDNLYLATKESNYIRFRKYDSQGNLLRDRSGQGVTPVSNIFNDMNMIGTENNLFLIGAVSNVNYITTPGLLVFKYDLNLNLIATYEVPINTMTSANGAQLKSAADKNRIYFAVRYTGVNGSANVLKNNFLAIDYNGGLSWARTPMDNANGIEIKSSRDGKVYCLYDYSTPNVNAKVIELNGDGTFVKQLTMDKSNINGFCIDPPLMTFPDLW